MTDPVLRVQSQLTDRDHVLLGWLADHRVLTSFQIAFALFPSLDYAQERLRKLVRLGLLDRFRPHRADGGSYPYHYVLVQLGADVVSAQRGETVPRRDHARRERWRLTNRANLPHLLGVNSFFTDLVGYARTHTNCGLTLWWPAARCQRMGEFAEEHDDVHVRTYTPRSRPDGHATWVEDQRHVRFFLEFDLGTERPLTRLADKIDGYVDLVRVTKRWWPVLFYLPSAARERHLHDELSRAGVRYPVATAVHRLGRENPAGPVWWVHRRPGAGVRLVDVAPPNVSHTPR